MSRVFREALGDTHEAYDVLVTHLSVIRDVVHLAGSAGSFEELCRRLAERLVTGLGCERASVVAEHGGRPAACLGRYSQAERLGGEIDQPPAFLVALAREVVAARTLLRWDGETRPLPDGAPGSVVGWPLVVGGECIGAVLCEELLSTAWDLARQRALELIGEIIDQVATLAQVRLTMGAVQRSLEAELGLTRSTITNHEETLRAQSARIGTLTDALVASSHAKSSFLGLMSHELRTPLSVILGFGSILRDGLAGPVTDEQEHHLDRVLTNGRHLSQLVDDMLFFIDAETTKIRSSPEPVDMAALIDEVLQALPGVRRPEAPTLEIAIAPEAAGLRSDAALLRRALFHLVANAFKFTEHGSVRVEATRPEPGAVLIRVVDTGIGIAPEQRARIFELFRQGDDTHARRHEGVGLGLNLVRTCVVLLRGRCELRSGPGGGTSAELWVPDLAAARESAAATCATAPATRETAAAPDGRERLSRAGASASPSGRAGSTRG